MSKLMTGILISLAMGATARTTESQTRAFMNIQHTTLWQLIEVLIDHHYFTLDTIRQIFPIEFSQRSDNGYFSFYEGGPFRLADQIAIETVHLIISKEDDSGGDIGLDIGHDTPCITLDEVRAHYPDIVVTSAPRGHSLDEKTHWTIRLPWGRLIFGFKERNPDCLASIGISRNELSPSHNPQTHQYRHALHR